MCCSAANRSPELTTICSFNCLRTVISCLHGITNRIGLWSVTPNNFTLLRYLTLFPPLLLSYVEAEVLHGRFAMLGVAGCLAVEVMGLGNWLEAPLWVRTRKP